MLLRSEIQAKYIKHSNTDNRPHQTAIRFLFIMLEYHFSTTAFKETARK